jgi:hypothetical protein
MAPDEKSPQETKTLEMRIAAIEDKLAQMSVSEDEMRAYQKVTSLMAGRAPGTVAPPQLRRGCVSILPIRPIFPPIGPIIPVFPPIIIADCIPISATGAQFQIGGFGALGR